MSRIIPAVIPNSLTDVQSVVDRFGSFTHEIQIDIVDGVFTPFTSWPYLEGGEVSALKSIIAGFVVEADLMVMEPEKVIAQYLDAGVTSVVVHLESVADYDALFNIKKEMPFMLGLSINNDTELHLLTDVIQSADYIQLMGIGHIGTQGQPFDERVLGRIRTLKAAHSNLKVSIDGSVRKETIPLLRDAGADRFVVGSAFMHAENPEKLYQELNELVG